MNLISTMATTTTAGLIAVLVYDLIIRREKVLKILLFADKYYDVKLSNDAEYNITAFTVPVKLVSKEFKKYIYAYENELCDEVQPIPKCNAIIEISYETGSVMAQEFYRAKVDGQSDAQFKDGKVRVHGLKNLGRINISDFVLEYWNSGYETEFNEPERNLAAYAVLKINREAEQNE
ncbi:MAG: hypothetical protein JRN26_01030 [Nitrososphaerota archaeon]|jgi:hypothetical protein|nr:hypothetical protein [Nitrososphaerota archaeon]MDG6935463.1 hypothetical protein [Nitrososphaerota archaeon]MDG6944353.1 hypothetical protein [Nitrososphaerota archaeon]